MISVVEDGNCKRTGLGLAAMFQQDRGSASTEELALQPELRIGWQGGKN